MVISLVKLAVELESSSKMMMSKSHAIHEIMNGGGCGGGNTKRNTGTMKSKTST